MLISSVAWVVACVAVQHGPKAVFAALHGQGGVRHRANLQAGADDSEYDEFQFPSTPSRQAEVGTSGHGFSAPTACGQADLCFVSEWPITICCFPLSVQSDESARYRGLQRVAFAESFHPVSWGRGCKRLVQGRMHRWVKVGTSAAS